MSAPSRSVAGVIPAAGASHRMGRPKAFLEIGGDTFLQRVVRALADGGCDPVYVVVEGGDRAAEEEAAATGARVLSNPVPGEGPITSLRLALAVLDDDTDGVVYLPLDHALVEPRHVARLLEEAHTAEAPLALPVHRGKRGHPAFFARSLFDELSDPGLEGGARTVVHRYLDRARLLPTDDPAVVVDIDTPEAYEKALALYEAAMAQESP